MSVVTLKKLVPPPKKPFEVGSLERWQIFEEKLGISLPQDYRQFVFAYGSGLFANLYRVYNPFAKDEYMALKSMVDRVCGINRQSQQSNPKRFPYPYYPVRGGLLPWGNDENGNDYYWLTEGPPSKWVVVQDENRGAGIRVQPFTMTGFLTAILQRKVQALASSYPRKEHFTFKSYDPNAS